MMQIRSAGFGVGLVVLGSFGCSGSSDGAATSVGGANANGGATGSAGASATSPRGGALGRGGASDQNATSFTGGAPSSGDATSTGGSPSLGGSSTSAGGKSTGTGGNTETGGSSAATGGRTQAGGTSNGTGGRTQAGGTSNGTGGTSPVGGSSAVYAENPGANCQVSAGAAKVNRKLPDPFLMHDGTRISTKAQWQCRRNEIKKDIERYEIGTKPDPSTVVASVSGSTLSVKVTTSAGSITLTSSVSGSGDCVVIGMNGASSLVSGCRQVPFMHDQVVKYEMSGTQTQSDPFYKVYPNQWGKIGNYTAWSWGISRLIDGLVQVKDQLKIDPTKIAVHGCSYAGKMALFGGAFDARVALTIAQESGGGGINSWRTSQDFTTRTGTNIEKIDNTSGSWFLSSMKSLDPYSLPHDHHELIAMIAPRAIIALGNADYDWLGDESGYKSVMAAAEVFKALGVTDRLGYDFTSGHSHCAAATSQVTNVNTFVNRFLKDQPNTNVVVAIKPTSSKFDLNFASAIDWTMPTLQ
jgi:hypothetical protein